ncbi:hypothetical protein BH11CYA1_BH11CYA1_23500 [soil metagenome]
MNSTTAVPFFLAPLVIILAIAMCSALGHIIASRYVEARHNLGAVFGGLFGILLGMTVAGLMKSPELGFIGLLITTIYTTFVVRLQRGY